MFCTGEYVLRMPPWSLSPELIRAITPGTPPEAHVDNQLHDSWAMGCLFYEALTDMHLFGKHVGAYKAQAVAAHVQPGSSEQGGEQKGCLFYEALTDMHLFGKHVGAYKAQAVAAHVQPGSSEQGGEQEGEQEGGQEGEQDGEESQAAGDVHFVLLQHQLWVSLCFLCPTNQFEQKSLQRSNALSCLKCKFMHPMIWAC